MQTLKQLPNLMILFLHGNSFCLLPHYRDQVVHSLQQLMHLDGKVITEEEKKTVATRLSNTKEMIEINLTIQQLSGITIEGTVQNNETIADAKKNGKAAPAMKKNALLLPATDEPMYEKK